MTTREKIELEALNLFCTKGYTGVSIRDIAKCVGIKESSIYKHYKGKEDIFNTIIDHYNEKAQNIFAAVPNDNTDFISISIEKLIDMIQSTFQVFVLDEYISKCRKLLMISAPGNEKLGKLYTECFISGPITCNQSIFQMIIQQSSTEWDAETMAYQFYSPIFCIMQEYDNTMLSMEEAMFKIEKITKQFAGVYGL